VNTTDSVTWLDMRNRELLVIDGQFRWSPRWIPIRVIENGPPCLAALWKNGDDQEPLRIAVLTCRCGMQFAVRHYDRGARGEDPCTICRDCDKKRLAESQKRARDTKRKGALRGVCDFCGNPMEPNRRTRKFCSPKCRIASFRNFTKQGKK